MFNSINCFLRGAVELINNTTTLILKLAVIGLFYIIGTWANNYQ